MPPIFFKDLPRSSPAKVCLRHEMFPLILESQVTLIHDGNAVKLLLLAKAYNK